MWTNKQPQQAAPTAPVTTVPAQSDSLRGSNASVRTSAWLGPTVVIKGEISGNEDLHIDGKVEGPITLGGHRLTVGRSAEIDAELVAREIVVYGKVRGDIRARDRIEIRKDGSVVGDLNTARIVIEDGAYFKGTIEIDRSSVPVGADLDSLLARSGSKPAASPAPSSSPNSSLNSAPPKKAEPVVD